MSLRGTDNLYEILIEVNMIEDAPTASYAFLKSPFSVLQISKVGASWVTDNEISIFMQAKYAAIILV